VLGLLLVVEDAHVDMVCSSFTRQQQAYNLQPPGSKLLCCLHLFFIFSEIETTQ
jgi:hypothetical protein